MNVNFTGVQIESETDLIKVSVTDLVARLQGPAQPLQRLGPARDWASRFGDGISTGCVFAFVSQDNVEIVNQTG